MDGNELIRKKAIFFFEHKIKIHVTRKDGFFYNGIILEIEGNDLFILDDEKLNTIPVYFDEIKDIQKREAKR